MIPRRIVVAGGSTVYGEGDPEHGGFVAHLRRWHEARAPHANRVFNLGIGGDTVAAMSRRVVSEAEARSPHLIILYPGLNDTRRLGSPAAAPETEFALIREQLAQLIDGCRELCPVVLMSATPPDEAQTTPFLGRWHFLYGDAVVMAGLTKELADEKQLSYFDLFERWADRPDLLELLADGLHLNQDGHRQLSQELSQFLVQKYGSE